MLSAGDELDEVLCVDTVKKKKEPSVSNVMNHLIDVFVFAVYHTVSQSKTIFKLQSSMLQMASNGKGIALYSVNLLYIVHYLPNSGVTHCNMGCEGRGKFQGTPYAFKADLS